MHSALLCIQCDRSRKLSTWPKQFYTRVSLAVSSHQDSQHLNPDGKSRLTSHVWGNRAGLGSGICSPCGWTAGDGDIYWSDHIYNRPWSTRPATGRRRRRTTCLRSPPLSSKRDGLRNNFPGMSRWCCLSDKAEIVATWRSSSVCIRGKRPGERCHTSHPVHWHLHPSPAASV